MGDTGGAIGEFRARLDLLWQFHADMAVDARAAAAAAAAAGGDDARGGDSDDDDDVDVGSRPMISTAAAGGARELALSNVLYNTWRYYVQFAPTVANRVEAARAPAAQKLRDHAKLAKWEDRG